MPKSRFFFFGGGGGGVIKFSSFFPNFPDNKVVSGWFQIFANSFLSDSAKMDVTPERRKS